MPICPICSEIYLDASEHEKDRHAPAPASTRIEIPPERGPVRREPRIAEMRREEEEGRIRRLLEKGIEIPGRRLVQGRPVPEIELPSRINKERKDKLELPSRINKERKDKLTNETRTLISRFNSLAQDFKAWPREQFFPGAIQNAQDKLTKAFKLLERNRSILSESIPRLEALDEVERNNKRVIELLDEFVDVYQKDRLKVGEQVKKRYEPEKEAETRERLGGLGLLPPGTPIEEARKKPPERPPAVGPPAPPEGRREEGGVGWAEIYGKVEGEGRGVDRATVIAFSPQIQRDILAQTDPEGKYSMNVPAIPNGIPYSIVAQARGFKESRRISVGLLKPGDRKEVNITLEPDVKARKEEAKAKEKEAEEERLEKREKELFGKVKERLGIGKKKELHETRWFQWLQDHIITLIFSIVFFLLLKFWLYPLIVNKIPFIGGALGRGVIFSWGIPLLVSTLFFYTIKDKGWWGTIKTLIPWGIGLLLFLILFGTHIQWTNFNYWLDRLDALKFIGVPQESIDDIKNNIKSALGFLQFKAVEPKKPEAKKIGGFEAIELKFGSKYNNFVPPQLFARTNYTLPVTVKNPNKIDTKLEVENFVIEEVFLNNRGNRVICGGITDKDGKETDKIELGKISPEEERLVTINFGNKTKCAKDSKSPLSPVKFRIVFKGTPDKNPEVNNKKCVEQCDPIVDKTNKTYGLSPGNMLDESGTVYISSSRECECKVKRIHNIMDELCFFDNDKAQVTLRSTYEFKVQGKGELIIVKTEADRKLAPPPTITSSAGPLTVTTYFVSDVHIPGKSKTSTMFIEISNKGNGGATITDFKVNGVDLRSEGPLTLQDNLVKISQCQPSIINFIEDAFTLSCSVSVDDSEVNSKVTGAYLTVPVIVDINYSYSQTHSTTINVEKAVIPEGVEDYDKIIELDGRFKHLPYYCPNEKSQIAGTPALKIYDIQSSS